MTTENLVQNDKEQKVKCVVWDLDNTLWDGVLLEDDQVLLRDGVTDIIKTLDSRGVLQSIASKNEHDHAMSRLEAFGLSEYFLYPQINWNSKAQNIETIAKKINIGIDTFAFIDDQPFEREEVNFSLPDVLCIDAVDIDKLSYMPAMNPRFITSDSSKRRLMYINDIQREKIEEDFVGPKEDFLATLDMVFTIAPASVEDLKRAEELTVRTHQLNTTGDTYSYEELDHFRQSDKYILLVAGLDDKYGTYGKIGVTLIECNQDVWTIKLLLMSCRVMSRGVGSVMINHLRNEARKNGVRLQAEFISNDRNRMMYMTYKFAHFKEKEQINDRVILENDLTKVQAIPDYVKVMLE
jgi:FkbH-like protein